MHKQVDHKFFVEKGDPGFSPRRNKAIIDETIKKTNANYKLRQQQVDEALGERVDAVVTYIKSKSSTTPVERYFGKRNLAYLRGQKISEIIKSRLMGKERLVYISKE